VSHTIIDRRKNAKGKSNINRQKFVRRVREQIRKSVKDVVRDSDIETINGDSKKVWIPGKKTDEPTFHHSNKGGIRDRVYPGNKQFDQGDKIARPPGGSGSGPGAGDASDSGEGEDTFGFNLTREEFMDIFFEDLELPDLIKTDITKVEEFALKRSGFSVDGSPSRMNIQRTMKTAKSRRLALRQPKKRKLREAEEELELLMADTNSSPEAIAELQLLIETLKKQIRAIPFIDDIDLRYNRFDVIPLPSTQAVMFCLMDVSGSMTEWHKEMAKRFFMLLYLFLVHNYEKVEIVFVRHHTDAKEVTEEQFFHDRDTGGTLVSTGIQLVLDIIKERYNPANWNIFVSQASDGDNWSNDNEKVLDCMDKLLPMSQYYAYVNIDKQGKNSSDLWKVYEGVAAANSNFEMRSISDVNEIYKVFRGLFEKREG
jgi:uncharacterized sporulation protein YeaH/YhbH (DUF444 family)